MRNTCVQCTSHIAALLALAMLTAGCAGSIRPSQTKLDNGNAASVIVIQSYEAGLSAIHTANPGIKLSLGQDPELPHGRMLLMEYPAPTANPAGRDVWCDVEHVNWTSGRAISFRIKPDHALRLSVSFLDKNQVAYTSWTDLQAAVWQTVLIPFDQIRPNPYFQPPGANKGSPLNVSEVTRLGFAPQDQSAGRLAIGRFVVVK